MKNIVKIFVIILLLQSINSFAQSNCCKAHAGPPKSYCKDSVQIGDSPADSVSCGRACSIIHFSWLPTTGLSNPHVANPWVHPSSTTTYTLEVIVINSTTGDTCCKSFSTTTVTYLPRCSANAGSPKLICCGPGTVTIGGSPAAVDSCSGCDSTLYSWLPTTGLSNSHVANPNASPTITTTYTLHIYAYNKSNHDTCCTVTSTVKVTVNGLCCRTAGINSIATNENIKVYPNPATQIFTIEINQVLQNGQVELYDVNGRIVWQKQNISKTDKLNVDLSTSPEGIYFVKIKENNLEIYSKKVLLR